MKPSLKSLGLISLATGLAAARCAGQQTSLWDSLTNSDDVQRLKSFIAEKEAQANTATNEPPAELPAFFAAAQEGDWAGLNGIFKDYRNHAGQYEHTGATNERLRGTKWQDIIEVWGGLEAFVDGNENYSALYANDIIGSLPPGSIYFGGTDPGRFLVTAMEKSQVDGDPFLLVTQNALADGTYLDYLRTMYGDKIYIPTKEDSQQCFSDYSADAQQRMKNGQLKEGEKVSTDPNTGRLQIAGQVAVMEINGLLAKVIFDHNTDRDFYIEESFPLDWMYPHLEPHGLIFKLNREPLAKLSDETLQKDRDYWTKTITPMIGSWLTDDTSVADISAYAEKVFLNHDFSNFTGDTNFVLSRYSYRTFSKERNSIGGLYTWRAKHTDDAAEKDRMNRAADFAFRQSWALCPDLPEVVSRYVELLNDEKRHVDALTVAETAAECDTTNAVFQNLVTQLKQEQH
ncbi:MAG TPA: hypothetical protein VGJ73_24140 [Verrucomicrobiae bacterium]|jgi:hypothetical protein